MERAVFPRYHIGESLQPSCLRILGMTGAKDKVEAYGFVRKHGALFDWGQEEWELNFAQLPEGLRYGWQVIRAEFDKVLLDHAREQGATVREGTEVLEFRFDGETPRSAVFRESGDGSSPSELAFDFLVDASGRAGLMATRYLKSRRFPESFQNVAIWGYWRGARKLDHGPENAIAVCSVPYGWLWAIPLHDGTTSIGLVTHKATFKEKREERGGLRQLLLDAVADNSMVARLAEPGELEGEIKVEQDYSYTSDRFSGPGYFMVGDAACFLDPLLSTGVHLATFSAMLAAAGVATIARGEMEAEAVRFFYDGSYRAAFLRLMVLVSSFYETYAGQKSYFWEAQSLSRNDWSGADVKAAFVNIVAGMEDLRDTEHATEYAVAKVVRDLRSVMDDPGAVGQMSVVERERFLAKADLMRTLFHGSLAVSPQSAVGGLYVTAQPRLGLARVDQPTAV